MKPIKILRAALLAPALLLLLACPDGPPDNNYTWNLTTSFGSGWPTTIQGRDVCLGAGGDVWEGTADDGIYVLNGGTVAHHYTISNSDLPDNNIVALMVEGSTTYVGTYHGLAVLSGASWTVYQTGTIPAIPDNEVYAIFRASDGKLWVASGNYIGYGAALDSMTWTNLDTDLAAFNIDSDGYIIDIAEDADGNIWLICFNYYGPVGGGLIKIDPTLVATIYRVTDGLPTNDVKSVAFQSPGTLWIGTGDGLVKYQIAGNTWTTFNTGNSGLPNDLVYAAEVGSDGTVWAGTGGSGLAWLALGTWNVADTTNSALPDDYVFNLAIEPAGDVWISMGSGFALFEKADQ